MIVRELNVRNPIGRWFQRHQWGGFCLVLPYMCIVLYWNWETVPEFLRRHEMIHVIQVARYGFFGFYARYFWWLWKYGYENHPMEKEARQCEDC